MTVEEEEQVTGVAEVQDAVEPSESGEGTQVAAEKEEQSQAKIDWVKARETMKQQSDQIKFLNHELQQLKGEKLSKKEKQEVNDLFAGRDNDDLPTIGELRALEAKIKAERDAESKEQQIRLDILYAKARYPDMDEVINKYGKQLPESVRIAIMESSNPHITAYEACIASEAYYKDKVSSVKHDDAKRAERNLSKPGSSSGIGTGGVLSKASRYENMSDAELLAMSDGFISG